MSDLDDTPTVRLDRLWIPHGTAYDLTPGGWLAEPAKAGFFVRNAEVIPTEELAVHRCLVLLGEPGIGKTKTITMLPLPETGSTVSTQSLHFDLGSFSSEDRLARTVFEAPEIRTWLSGTGILVLTLDAFDEARARIETLPRLLAEYLNQWDCQRLYIRIVSRTADWPPSLGQVLNRSFGKAEIFELLPLRRQDAWKLLNERSPSGQPCQLADETLVAIENANVVPLAARPLTLELLRAAMSSDGAFPNDSAHLYARGLLALVDESTMERRDSWPNRVPAEMRFASAARLAAISIFCGRPTIWLGSTPDMPVDQVENDILVGQIPTQSEDGDTRTVEAVLQAVRSGLFRGAGDSRVAWAHATFADFLAAHWIVSNELSDDQVRSLICADDDRIYVRLRQVAAWLVRISPQRFRWVLTMDSEALLANVDIPDHDLRALLVTAIIEGAKRGELFYDFGWNLKGLRHAGLANQLRIELQEASQPEVARLIINIARQCFVTELIDDLSEIAHNQSREAHLRVAAAMGVHHLSSEIPTDRLASLVPPAGAATPSEVELPAELEGAALLASWPHAISTEEVLRRFNPRHARNFTGIYSMFLDEFASGFNVSDIPAAYEWLSEDPGRLADERLAALVRGFIRVSVEGLDQPEAGGLLRLAAKHKSGEFEPLLNDEWFINHKPTKQQRRAIAWVLMDGATEDEVLTLTAAWHAGEYSLLQANDFNWLLRCYEDASPDLRQGIAPALRLLYDPSDAGHSDKVLGLADNHPAVSLFTHWRTTVELNTPETLEAQRLWREFVHRREARRQAQDDSRDAWVNPQIIIDAEAATRGDLMAFWRGLRSVTIRPKTLRYANEYDPDMSSHPRWFTLPESTRKHFLEAAPLFLNTASCEPQTWLGQERTSFIAAAAYRALILLLRDQPRTLELFEGRVWREWAPILIDWKVTANGARWEDKEILLKLAEPHASDELRAALLVVIDAAIRDGRNIFGREELGALISEQLVEDLAARLRLSMSMNTLNDILDALLKKHAERISPILLDWLNDDNRSLDAARAHTAFLRLLQCHAMDSWRELRSLMHRDPLFVQEALLEGSFVHDHHSPDLPEAELGDLYVWVCQNFPQSEDPQHEGVHFVGPREGLASWRDGLLATLQGRGTTESVEAMENVARALPEQPWLVHALGIAKHVAREQAWRPLSPADLDNLAALHTLRIVRNDSDLAAITMRALEEIQKRLQGDTPTSHLLWDTHSGRPKTEDHISDYVADELQRRINAYGIVVNREVQVRRSGASGGLPERTDIRVEAFPAASTPSNATLAVPVEVKGNWNRDVIVALRNQLVDRYMADLHTNHGIYIVAWFDQKPWSATTDRRKQLANRWTSRGALQSALEAELVLHEHLGKKVEIIVLDFSLSRADIRPL